MAKYLVTETLPNLYRTKCQQVLFLRKASRFKVQGEEKALAIVQQGVLKQRVLMNEIAPTMFESHDYGGHFTSVVTIWKLSKYYWPVLTKNLRNYIAGCLVYAKYGTVVRSKFIDKVMTGCSHESLQYRIFRPFPEVLRS